MAAFVSLATCHHCNLSCRQGLVYRDSISALSRNLVAPGYRCRHTTLIPALPLAAHRHSLQTKRRSRLPRDPPESIDLARSQPAGMKHFIFAHLQKLLTLSPSQRCRERSLKLLV